MSEILIYDEAGFVDDRYGKSKASLKIAEEVKRILNRNRPYAFRDK